MNRFVTIAVLGTTMFGGSAGSAQVVDPALSRDLGRAVGQATVAAEQAAAEARIAAREALRAARQGYAEGTGRASFARPAQLGTEDEAVDACAIAAEQHGYDQGFRAVVRDIQGVDRRPEGWDVDGTVEARRSWREPVDVWGFRCQVRDGRVVNVDIGHDFARR